jgi:hypothetical protein
MYITIKLIALFAEGRFLERPQLLLYCAPSTQSQGTYVLICAPYPTLTFGVRTGRAPRLLPVGASGWKNIGAGVVENML